MSKLNSQSRFKKKAVGKLSVIIIARNEEKNIRECLSTIAKNDLNILQEIILVDDHSEDRTVEFAEWCNIPFLKILHLKDFKRLDKYGFAYKKAAQEYAIMNANTDIILSTDGDCSVQSNWVESMFICIEESNHDIVTGPIQLIVNSNDLGRFQEIEMMGTMAGTKAGIQSKLYYSANAANMIYKKSVYEKYLKEERHTGASGDDVHLVQWAANNDLSIGFAGFTSAIVHTKGEESLSAFWQQRLRWATKTKAYLSWRLPTLMGSVYLFHLLMLLTFVIGLMGSPQMLVYAFAIYILKLFMDYVLLRKVGRFFSQRIAFGEMPKMILYHTFYVIIIGTAGLLFKNFIWKGRKVS